MLQSPLTADQDTVLKDERRALAALRTALARHDAPADQQAALDRSIEQLDELFLLVIVGEFNAGKSAFINALLGSRVVEEGVTPTTAQINVIRYGDAVTREQREPYLHVITAPAPMLRDIHIVDTPGTNAIIREHERITSEFVPRSDLVLFVTSADRPFTETERAFLEQLRGWGKKIVIVVNKVDILEGQSQVDEVTRFVSESARTLLGIDPGVFPVSAKLALRAKQGDPTAWAASRFEALESFIARTLDAPGRLQLKLMNPLGVGLSVAERQQASVQDRLDLLKEDFATLDQVDRQLTVYQQDLERDLGLRMADIDRILLEMERRGHDFFDETLRIGRVPDLLNRSRLTKAFEEQVVADAPQQIEKKIGELVDWLVDMDLRQWQGVTGHLAERRRQYRDRIVGEESGQFMYDRSRLIDAVTRESQRVVDSYDRRKEAQEIADGARNAVAAAAAVGAGALGLGTIVAAAATTAAADVTGFAMASVLAAIGFFILPAKRQRAKEEMRRKVADLRERLSSALRETFTREIGKSSDRIREGVAPYSRFVRAEGEKLGEYGRELQSALAALTSIRQRLTAVSAPATNPPAPRV